MYRRIFALAALLAAVFAGGASAADLPVKAAPAKIEPPFFFVNENSLSYHYEFVATNPGAGKTPKWVVSFTHFDVWAYGTNFFNVDLLKATRGAGPGGTPAAPCDFAPPTATGCPGYTEIYGLFRSTFGWNQLTKSKMFSMGPLTNIEWVIGADFNTDNTSLGSAKKSIQGGVQFDFATPYKGFFNVSVGAYHEWQHDGFASLSAANGFGSVNPSGNVEFKTTWVVEYLYVQPLGFMPPSIPLTFKAFGVIHGPKGTGEPGAAPTTGLNRTTEYLTQETLHLDVGKMMTGKPNMFSVWGGYRYWVNKFGIDPNQPPGVAGVAGATNFTATVESTWLVGTTLAF